MVVDPRKESPYVGPRPFELSERKIFWGRRRETRQIVDRIFANRILLLYAPSGAGKTSLLNAGIIPQLKEEGFDVLPLARVKGPIPLKRYGTSMRSIAFDIMLEIRLILDG
jgi:ABC-type phosphate transport system ATPase subunit